MKRGMLQSLVLLFVGGTIGAETFARLDSAQESRPVTGYSFWSKADFGMKAAYLTGYTDAEGLYRLSIDTGIRPLCTDAGKGWIADFETKIPLPDASISQVMQGLDEFYKDLRNQSVSLYLAQNIVRLQLAGRPQSEIDEAIRKAREGDSEK